MCTIETAEIGHYRIPLPSPIKDATHVIPDFEIVTLRLRDTDGAEGLGYTYTVGKGGVAIAALLSGEIADLVKDQDAAAPGATRAAVANMIHWGGRGGATTLALSALDMALWDLVGRHAQMPLWRILGGGDPVVDCYAGGIDLHMDVVELCEQADRFRAEGFRAIKMKLGRANLREDIERVAAMRAHLGDDFPLMGDVNMGWTLPQAVTACRALSEFRLVWVEEPTDPDDMVGHGRILREGGTPIAAGENLRSLAEFRMLIDAHGVSYPEPDVANCGGISEFMKIAHLAEANNLSITSHGMHDVTVHLLAACTKRSRLEVHGFSLDDYITHPLPVEDGAVRAPERPGHGVEFLWDKLARHSVR